MGKEALGGMGKATLGGMMNVGIGVPGAPVKKPPVATTSVMVIGMEGTQRPSSVVVTATDLGFIAPVVSVTGGAGQDEERGSMGSGWSRRGSAGLVEDKRRRASGGERRHALGPSCQRQAWG
jgi:hypothetical protein